MKSVNNGVCEVGQHLGRSSMKMVLICAVALIFCGRCAGESTLHLAKDAKTVKLSIWLRQRIRRDTALIAADRAKLIALAGKSGHVRQRRQLLNQMRICRVEITACKNDRCPHFGYLIQRPPPLPKGWYSIGDTVEYHFRRGNIGRLYYALLVDQILSPTSAICRVLGEHRVFLVTGVDFSGKISNSAAYYPGLCQVGKPYTYATIDGSSNTIPAIHAIRFVVDVKPKH